MEAQCVSLVSDSFSFSLNVLVCAPNERLQTHLWFVICEGWFSYCVGALNPLEVATLLTGSGLPAPGGQVCTQHLVITSTAENWGRSTELHVDLWWDLSMLALRFDASHCCLVSATKNWHSLSLQKQFRGYGGWCWKLYNKFQFRIPWCLVGICLQALSRNVQVKTRINRGLASCCRTAFHEMSLLTGDRWQLLSRLDERLRHWVSEVMTRTWFHSVVQVQRASAPCVSGKRKAPFYRGGGF